MMDVLDVLLDKLDALGVLVVVITYVLIREKNNKKATNPNGIIKPIEDLATEVREHNRQSSERMIIITERLSNMGTNMVAVFTLLGEIKTECIKMAAGKGNPE